MEKLDYFIKKDPRIKKVYDYAKEKYIKANLPLHNFEHVLRGLYRALIIAETEKDVDYKILIPAVLLHDIGATEGDYWKHEESGPMIVKRDLEKFGYSKEEIDRIVHCVASHGEKGKPQTIEAKILFDADRLEKSGIGGVFNSYRGQLEFEIPLEKFVGMVNERMKKFIQEGFYTKKAKEICDNGFQEWFAHFARVKKSLKKRKDFLISENDLWEK